MQLTKYRAFGKFRVIQMAVSLLSMLIYWGFSSGIFEILFNYNESSIDYNAQKAEQVRHDMLESSMYLSEYMNIQGYTTTIMFILMLAVLILFYQEKNGLFTFRYVRGESQKKVILSTIFQYSWINALWYYIIYIIYLSIGTALWETAWNIYREIHLTAFLVRVLVRQVRICTIWFREFLLY